MSNNPQPSKSERILDVAEAHFLQHGYDGVTMRQVAQLFGPAGIPACTLPADSGRINST
jgi:hypothetical protein